MFTSIVYFGVPLNFSKISINSQSICGTLNILLLKFVKNLFVLVSAECADMWYDLSSKEKEENIHVMKIYLLSPFLFGQVKSNQDDKVKCGIRNTIAGQSTT